MHVSNETHSSRLQCKESKNILLLRMAGVSMKTSHGKQPVNFVYQPTVTQTTGEDWIENLYFESAITENLLGSVQRSVQYIIQFASEGPRFNCSSMKKKLIECVHATDISSLLKLRNMFLGPYFNSNFPLVSPFLQPSFLFFSLQFV